MVLCESLPFSFLMLQELHNVLVFVQLNRLGNLYILCAHSMYASWIIVCC